MAYQFQEQTQGHSETQIQALRGELDAANKKVDRYVHLVASLYEELDNLRRSICHNCKQKFVPSYAPVSSSSVGPGGPRPPFWRRIISGRQTQTPSSGLLSTNAGASSNTSSPIRFITAQQNQTNSTISTPPDAPSSTPKQPSTTSVDEKHKQPSWSVSHNPEIKRVLHIDLVKTFNFTAWVFRVKFSPDGKYLTVGERNGKTYIYDVEKGLKICTLVDLYLKDSDQPVVVWGVQFSPDNKYIAIASGNGIRLWDIAQKRTRAVFPRKHVDANSVCFSPNGRSLVACEGSNASIWSLRDGSSKILSDDAVSTFSITFSPDGRHIASVDYSGWLRIWDARVAQLLDRWKGHPGAGYCVAFSPDGKGLVSGGDDRILKYWDVSSLADLEVGRGRVIAGSPGQRFQQIRKFDGHSSWIRSVSFSPDHQWVATSSLDRSVRIWDPHTAEWQCTLEGHAAYVRAVDFSPAGKYLASGGEDSQVRLWRYI